MFTFTFWGNWLLNFSQIKKSCVHLLRIQNEPYKNPNKSKNNQDEKVIATFFMFPKHDALIDEVKVFDERHKGFDCSIGLCFNFLPLPFDIYS